MALLLDRLQAFCETEGLDKIYWVSYSGGLDSHVLLHLCAQLRQLCPLKVQAVHVNHGLSPNAFTWEMHCAQVCNDLQIELSRKKISIHLSAGDSIEDRARHARYLALAELVNHHNAILLTAHQQEDQAETVLVQLLRGAGPKGLAAMPALKVFGQGFHGRPLLDVSRSELMCYAEEHHLMWIHDESNDNQDLTRNFFRHTIFPLLKQRWPTATKTLARVAVNCAESQEIVEEIAQQDLAMCRGNEFHRLSVKKLILLNASRQRQVLREWFFSLNFPLPSSVKLHQIQRDFLTAALDKSPYQTWDEIELRRYQGELYVMKSLAAHDPRQVFDWDLSQSLQLPGLGQLDTTATEKSGLRVDIVKVKVAFRQGGESCYDVHSQCHQSLKNIFQARRVPPWERERLPLVYVDGILVAVVGLFLDKRYEGIAGRQLCFKKG